MFALALTFHATSGSLRSGPPGTIWGFPGMGVPPNGWFIWEYPIKMDDDWGYPCSPILGHHHIPKQKIVELHPKQFTGLGTQSLREKLWQYTLHWAIPAAWDTACSGVFHPRTLGPPRILRILRIPWHHHRPPLHPGFVGDRRLLNILKYKIVEHIWEHHMTSCIWNHKPDLSWSFWCMLCCSYTPTVVGGLSLW